MSNVQNLFSQPSFPAPLPGQSFFGAGNIQIYSSSGTFVVPPGVTRIRVRVWGAGGSGGCTCEVALGRVASGGGGGGHGMKVIDTTPGTSYTVTVGAGGAQVNGTVRNNGNAGGTSSFGTAVTCTGGGGGAATGGAAPITVSGGTGGTSTGGDVNYSGGAGGSATVLSTTAGFSRSVSSGGGASGSIFGNGFRGGNISLDTGVGANCSHASGGGGVGGRGGDITSTINSAGQGGGGGGTYSNAADMTNSNYGNAGGGFTLPFTNFENNQSTAARVGSSAYLVIFSSVPADLFNVFGTNASQPQLYGALGTGYNSAQRVGSYPVGSVRRFPGDILISNAMNAQDAEYASIPIDGTGGFGSVATGTNITSLENKYAGAFGGGGGTSDTNNNGVKGFHGSIGGGGGGTAGRNNPDANTVSGRGGNGMVVVEW